MTFTDAFVQAQVPAMLGGRRRLRPLRLPARVSGSMSSSARPTRPDRCMSATAAARSSAMRWPSSWRLPGSTSPASTTSTTPGRRSRSWRARSTIATSRRWATRRDRCPTGSTRSRSWCRWRRAIAERDGDRWRDRPEADWLDGFGRAGRRCHAGADQGRSGRARRRVRRLHLRARSRRGRQGRRGAGASGAARPALHRHPAAAQGQARRGLGAGAAAACSRRASTATISTGRSSARPVPGPISPPISPITWTSTSAASPR